MITTFALLAVLGQRSMAMASAFVELADGSAIGMSPPFCLVSPMVQTFEFSPNGRWMLVESMVVDDFHPLRPSQPRKRLTLVDCTQRKTTVLQDKSSPGIFSEASFAGDDLIQFTDTVQVPSGPDRAQPGARTTTVLREAGGSKTWPIFDSGVISLDAMVFPLVMVAPKHGYAVILVQRRDGRASVDFFNFRTNLRKSISAAYRRFELDADGYLGQQLYQDRKATGQFERVLPDGSFTKVAYKPEPEPKQPKVSLMDSAAVLKLGKRSETISGYWLASPAARDRQFALVSADVDRAQLSPDGRRIAYLTDGNLFLRDLIELSKTDFEELQIREEQNELMMKAKQIATAIAIFCADSDDVFPAQEGFAEKIMPYVKNQSLLNGFTYTFSAKKATEIADPAATVIGYAQGRRGRAVAYADGHVKWIKNP